jgi:hypothetical protein
VFSTVPPCLRTRCQPHHQQRTGHVCCIGSQHGCSCPWKESVAQPGVHCCSSTTHSMGAPTHVGASLSNVQGNVQVVLSTHAGGAAAALIASTHLLPIEPLLPACHPSKGTPYGPRQEAAAGVACHRAAAATAHSRPTLTRLPAACLLMRSLGDGPRQQRGRQDEDHGGDRGGSCREPAQEPARARAPPGEHHPRHRHPSLPSPCTPLLPARGLRRCHLHLL